MERTGLVLGAGGSIGWAYHLGVLEGIEEVLGLTVNDAVRVIGTSAGAAIAGSVASGAGTEDILASIVAPIAPEDRARMEQARTGRRWWRYLRPQAPGMALRGGLAGLVGLLPAGVFPTIGLRRFPAADVVEWPSNLWLPAVRLDDGEVVVFGRDRTDVSVMDAVEASSAVPALFQPKRLDGQRFIDGAVASSTHADLLEPDRPELVVIAAPMTRPGRGPVKVRAGRQLDREAKTLRAAGAEVVTLRPDETVMELADGYPRHRPEAGPAIVAEPAAPGADPDPAALEGLERQLEVEGRAVGARRSERGFEHCPRLRRIEGECGLDSRDILGIDAVQRPCARAPPDRAAVGVVGPGAEARDAEHALGILGKQGARRRGGHASVVMHSD